MMIILISALFRCCCPPQPILFHYLLGDRNGFPTLHIKISPLYLVDLSCLSSVLLFLPSPFSCTPQRAVWFSQSAYERCYSYCSQRKGVLVWSSRGFLGLVDLNESQVRICWSDSWDTKAQWEHLDCIFIFYYYCLGGQTQKMLRKHEGLRTIDKIVLLRTLCPV